MAVGGDDEWEIRNDNGFVYKRRRRLADGDEDSDEGSRPPPAAEAAAEADLRRLCRSNRRRRLLDLRERYRAELEEWESMSSLLLELATPTLPAAAGSSVVPLELPDSCDGERHLALVDDLLAQAETQEKSLRKLCETCQYIESLCKEEDDSLMNTLLDLPIWGSPRTLINSLAID